VDNKVIKSVVTRYSTGSGIKAEFLVPCIHEIITHLYVYGLVVNNICRDGATENRNSFKQFATLTVRGVFVSRCDVCSATARKVISCTLLDNWPNDNLLIAFLHPCDEKIKIFVGGEMPHLIKKIVYRLEDSCDKKSKVALNF